jgi:hypothetical protein
MSSPDPAPGSPPPPPAATSASPALVAHIWWTRRALVLHLVIVVLVPTFLGLFWWQVQRVRQGNELSWAYVFEWPFFTGYAVYLWWKLVHDQFEDEPLPRSPCHPTPTPTTLAATTRASVAPDVAAGTVRGNSDEGDGNEDEDDEELAAYNRYLAELNASGRPKRW